LIIYHEPNSAYSNNAGLEHKSMEFNKPAGIHAMRKPLMRNPDAGEI